MFLVLLVNNVIVSGGVQKALIEAGFMARTETKKGEEAEHYEEIEVKDEHDKPVKQKKPIVEDRRINSKSRRKRELRARKGK
jgi:hypothetical protein